MTSDLRRLAGAAIAVVLLFAPAAALATVSTDIPNADGIPSRLYYDHMVMQHGASVPVWGTSNAAEHVTVTIASQTKPTVADNAGRWRVTLDPMPPGGPYDLVIQGDDNTLDFTDVMVGDVWLMAGQSNLMIRRPTQGDLAQFPNARVFKRSWTDRPGDIPFGFAKVMGEELGMTVGVLQCALRGASALSRTWLGPDATNNPDPEIQAIVASGNYGQSYMTAVRNVAGFPVKGMIWWQGESDARTEIDPGEQYSHVLPAIVESWRAAWNDNSIPFLFLQEPVGDGYQADQVGPTALPDPNFSPERSASFRDAYIRSLSEPNTQVITSADLVGGVHPRDREGYTFRIAAAVLGFVYGEPLTFAGPTYSSMSIESGNHVRLKFRAGTVSNLQSVGGPLQGFSISPDDIHFVWANAEIQGSDVVVWNDSVPSPLVVRYGYHKDYSFANLFNDAGMAAPTFTTHAHPYQ
ncbi:MAG TPA: sialate O-acetylesterase [Candidatus Binatia bacterium]